MPWPDVLVLVRHAESEGNVLAEDDRARYSVATQDLKLTPRGCRQAEITGQYLVEEYGDFDTYYVSYYTRSKHTMALMYPRARVYEEPRLAEAQRGIWQVMSHDDVAARYPDEVLRKEKEGLYHYRPFGGENWPDVELRIHSFLGTLSRDGVGQRVLIVVHGNWLHAFQRLVHHWSIEELLRHRQETPFENCSVTVYEGRLRARQSRLILRKENFVPWAGKL